MNAQTALYCVVVLAAVCVSLFYKLASEIEHLDFDVATLSIFINNFIFHSHFDFNFNSDRNWIDEYRVAWATVQLPWSWLFAQLTALFLDDPQSTPYALVAISTGLAIGGSLLAADLVFNSQNSHHASEIARHPSRRYDGADYLFLVAVCILFPTHLLLVRTGFLSCWLPYCLFWLFLNLLNRLGHSPRWIYVPLLAFASAALLLTPYPSALLCAIAAAGLIWQNGFRHNIGFRLKLYAACVGAFVIVLIYEMIAGEQFLGSFDRLLYFQLNFINARSEGFHLLSTAPYEHLVKLRQQLLSFEWVHLGNNRNDRRWLLGAQNIAWTALCLVAVIGVYQCWKSRRMIERWTAISLLAASLVFVTLLFPEGRYVSFIIPMIVFAAHRAISSFTQGAVRRVIFMALVLGLAIFNLLGLDRREDAPLAGRQMATDWGRLTQALDETDATVVTFSSPRRYEDLIFLRYYLNREIYYISSNAFQIVPQDPASKTEAFVINTAEADIDSVEGTLYQGGAFCLYVIVSDAPCRTYWLKIKH